MSVNDELGKRMKSFYEGVPKTRLVRRMPVMIRVDGRAFHTFLKNFDKPFDKVFMQTMNDTMQYLCENIMGCVLGYKQSDEITLVLVDYEKHTSQAWFDYEVQKMCSISASMATMTFNKALSRNVSKFKTDNNINITASNDGVDSKLKDLYLKYNEAIEIGAMFDSRCFNVPKEEVTNFIYWRQLDATRNSIQMVGQTYFSHKELHGKNQNDIQEMMFQEKGINWNDFSVPEKRGTCCVKSIRKQLDDGTARYGWKIDNNIPIFRNTARDYIDRLIYVGEM